jgi:FkbM family methyltransferase
MSSWYFYRKLTFFTLREFFSNGEIRFRDGLGNRFVSPVNNLSSLITYLNGVRDLAIHRFYEQWIRPGDIVIDVGANVGTHLFPMSRLVGRDGWVIGYDADPEICAMLDKSARLNRMENVTIRCCAVSSQSGILNLKRNQTNRGQTSVDSHDRRVGLAVNCTPLDLEVKTFSIQGKIRLIKIDVEGHETSVIEGAQQLLRQDGDIAIVMEHFEESGEAATSLLKKNGFTPYQVTSNGSTVVSSSSYGDNVVWLKSRSARSA